MAQHRSLPRSFFQRPAGEVAPDLLGHHLVRRLGRRSLILRIVETEAYLGASDRASHAWNDRRTQRTSVLFRRGGVAYVYFVYGMHYMLNVVTGGADDGSAVLIRAGEPVAGSEEMRLRRGLERAPRAGDLAGGPGKLCRALAIDSELNGAPLDSGPLILAEGSPPAPHEVAVGPRVGVAYAGAAADWLLRFAEEGNPHVSRPRL